MLKCTFFPFIIYCFRLQHDGFRKCRVHVSPSFFLSLCVCVCGSVCVYVYADDDILTHLDIFVSIVLIFIMCMCACNKDLDFGCVAFYCASGRE